MQLICKFTVEGIPQTAGSKRAFPFMKKPHPQQDRLSMAFLERLRMARTMTALQMFLRKRLRLGATVTDDNPKSNAWKRKVAHAARQVYTGKPATGPLAVSMIFYLPRPKNHVGTGRNGGKLKPSAPKHHTVRPDVLKLARCAEDALTRIVYEDDAQIVEEGIAKRYGNPPRVEVEVYEMNLGDET